MRKPVAALAVLCLLAACEGTPLAVDETEDVIDDGEVEDGVFYNLRVGVDLVLLEDLQLVLGEAPLPSVLLLELGCGLQFVHQDLLAF